MRVEQILLSNMVGVGISGKEKVVGKGVEG
jgi:hypothetical protein